MATTKRNRLGDGEPQPPRPESALRAHVALLAHADREVSTFFKNLFEDTAVDWRLIHVTDGPAATRHVMEHGLPQLIVLSASLPGVSSPDFVDWLRSFRSPRPLPILVYDDATGDQARDRFQKHDLTFFLAPTATRRELFDLLSPLIANIESRQAFRNQETGA